MPRVSPRLAFLSAATLLGLAGCAPLATATTAPTATTTTTPAAIATATLSLASTPTNVPAGWQVLDTPHFSMAYPPGFTPMTAPQSDGSFLYLFARSPNPGPPVDVLVQEHVTDASTYCGQGSGVQRVTLAGAPMNYGLSGEEGGGQKREWYFLSAQGTAFTLDADDTQSGAAIQAQDDAILATLTLDSATPWSC